MSMSRFPKILIVFAFLSCLAFFSLSAGENDLTALIEKGELLVEQKSYAAGIAVLETVLSKDENNSRALYSLLSAYDVYTTELASQNRFEQVQSYLPKMEALLAKIQSLPENASSDSSAQSRLNREQAAAKSYLADPNGKQAKSLIAMNAGRERYNEAVKQFTKREYEAAENLLKESIELDPTNAFAYELLGEIANLGHRLDEAEAYYQKAFSLNPDPRVRAKYEKIKKERELDQEQQQYADEHFIIRYKRSENLAGSKIREVLRDAYRAISQDFGHYPKYKISVILYDREEYQAVVGSVPHWSAALYDGKIRLPIYEQEGVNIKKLVFHELTHAFVLDLSRMKCSVWLNEGLAQFQENKIQAIDSRKLIDAVRNKSLMTMDQLIFTDISKTSDQDQAVLFYLESFSFASYLIEQKGFYRIKMLLSELGKGTQFPEAFETAFGRSFKDLAGEWQRDLERRYR